MPSFAGSSLTTPSRPFPAAPSLPLCRYGACSCVSFRHSEMLPIRNALDGLTSASGNGDCPTAKELHNALHVYSKVRKLLGAMPVSPFSFLIHHHGVLRRAALKISPFKKDISFASSELASYESKAFTRYRYMSGSGYSGYGIFGHGSLFGGETTFSWAVAGETLPDCRWWVLASADPRR